ncbi:MAG: Na/Pi cotransporter family protein [Candidatus Aenigmarchaeota archaeon]|nr:Na/Pi cotransporter family protein [Candidatus Aenigmarchaeota archaeon]
MDWTSAIIALIGGLALFLFGMKLLSDGLQNIAGEKLRKVLEKITNNPIKGVFVGASLTALIQSSSITTVTLVGLLNAGLITLRQAVGVILGAEIGTTITAQILAFKIGTMFFPLIALGVILQFSKKTKYNDIGKVILGFGILFLGMYTMSSSMGPLKESAMVVEMLASFGKTPILGVFAGALLTGIIQSSSATTGLVIAMGIENAITLQSAIAIILGANIGTCVTVMIASIGSSLSAKRAALSHFLFNTIGVCLFFPFIVPFGNLVSLTASDIPRQIANAHLIFNISMTIIMLPLIGLLVWLTKKIVPGKEVKVERGTKYIDERLIRTPALALEQSRKEVVRMGKIAESMLKDCKKALFEDDRKMVSYIKNKEKSVDEIDDLIEEYLIKISKKHLTDAQKRKLAGLTHIISDIERVSDHINNIGERIELKNNRKLKFSKPATKELKKMFKVADESYKKSIKLLNSGDQNLYKIVMDLEMEADYLENSLEERHLERLKKGTCKPEAGPLFLDMIRNLERITDHAHNIAYSVKLDF